LLNEENETFVPFELFGNSLIEKASNWFAYHKKIHPTNTLQEVFTAFRRRFQTIEIDDHTYIHFCTLVQLLNESVDDYTERLQQLAENLTIPPDDMFMLNSSRAGLLEYLQVAILGLGRQTFSKAVDLTRTAKEGLPKPGRSNIASLSTGKNPRRNMNNTGCGRMGHEWVTCF
jgi:hypothetical protein